MWIPSGPPLLDTSTGLSMALQNDDGWGERIRREICMEKKKHINDIIREKHGIKMALSTWLAEGIYGGAKVSVDSVWHLHCIVHAKSSITKATPVKDFHCRRWTQMETPFKWLRSNWCSKWKQANWEMGPLVYFVQIKTWRQMNKRDRGASGPIWSFSCGECVLFLYLAVYGNAVLLLFCLAFAVAWGIHSRQSMFEPNQLQQANVITMASPQPFAHVHGN